MPKPPRPEYVCAGLVAGLLLCFDVSTSASAQVLTRPSSDGYSSGRLFEPRPLTIRRSKGRAARPARVERPLRASEVLCPNPKDFNAPCGSARARPGRVSLAQAPGADAFKLGSATLAPPRVPAVDDVQSSGFIAQAIALAGTHPPAYPDIYARIPLLGVGARPPIYPDLFGIGYGYFLPVSGPVNRLMPPRMTSGGFFLPSLPQGF